MDKRSVVKLVAALASISVHLFAAVSLSREVSGRGSGERSPERMMAVTLAPKVQAEPLPVASAPEAAEGREDTVPAFPSAESAPVASPAAADTRENAPEIAPASTADSSGSADITVADRGQHTDSGDWSGWLPQLSNTPLPLAPGVPGFAAADAYLPGRELDERPAPQAPVIIPFPESAELQGRHTAILVLYIDADGRVQHVEVDESVLPPDFEKAAIDTFMQATMRPGFKNGQAVPSRMKIEVVYESN